MNCFYKNLFHDQELINGGSKERADRPQTKELYKKKRRGWKKLRSVATLCNFLCFCYIKLLMALDVYFYIGLIFSSFLSSQKKQNEKRRKKIMNTNWNKNKNLRKGFQTHGKLLNLFFTHFTLRWVKKKLSLRLWRKFLFLANKNLEPKKIRDLTQMRADLNVKNVPIIYSANYDSFLIYHS